MADVTDPQVVTFLNHMRSLAEEMREVGKHAQGAETAWFNYISSLTPNTDDLIEDGRGQEGISRVPCAKLWAFMNQVITLSNQVNDPDIAAAIAFITVQPY